MKPHIWLPTAFALVLGVEVAHLTEAAAQCLTPSISYVAEWPDGPYRKFAVTGVFPRGTQACATMPWRYSHWSCYGAHVFCNGAMFPAEITSYGPTQIVARIPERPSGAGPGEGSRCSIHVKLGQQGVCTVPDPVDHYLGYIAQPAIEITSADDLGRSWPYHYFRLHGDFPVGGTFGISVTCDDQLRTATITSPNPSTTADVIDIRFTDLYSTTASCVFTVSRVEGNSYTPPWYQRINGTHSMLPSYLGMYHWGGFEPGYAERTDALHHSVQRLADAGVAGNVRFVLSPQQLQTVGGLGTLPWPARDWYDDWSEAIGDGTVPACDALLAANPDPYLLKAVCRNRFQAGLAATPAYGTVVITTMDSAAAGPAGWDAHYVESWWMQVKANRDAVQNEYYLMAKALLTTQAFSGKTFILANWEGDNLLYCGSVYGVLMGTVTCPYELIPSRLWALGQWFKARRDGIDQAVAEMGWVGVTVADGIEFASYRMVQGTPGLAGKDVLHGIIPQLKPRYALYSAWETFNNGRADQDLRELAIYLGSVSTPQEPIWFAVGELGVVGQENATPPPQQVLAGWLLTKHVEAVRRNYYRIGGTPGAALFRFATLWQAFPTVDEQEALFTAEGAETEALRAVRAGDAAAWNPGYPYAINAVREVSPDRMSTLCPGGTPGNPLSQVFRNGNRYFELYGSFGTSYNRVSVNCSTATSVTDGWLTATVIGSGTGQFTISIPDSAATKDMWCRFQMWNTGSSAVSQEFGPVLSWGWGPCNPVSLP